MTKHRPDPIAETFNMSEIDKVKKALKVLHEDEGQSQEEITETIDITQAIADANSINQSLAVFDDPAFDQEMDDISKESEQASQELMDLGLSVETKYVAEIVSASERFKNIRLEAQKAKVNRKLKMLDLQLKERRLDLLEQKQNADRSQGMITGDGEYTDDRDDILED